MLLCDEADCRVVQHALCRVTLRHSIGVVITVG